MSKKGHKEIWKVQVVFTDLDGHMFDAIYKVVVAGADKIRDEILWRVNDLIECGCTWELGQTEFAKKV